MNATMDTTERAAPTLGQTLRAILRPIASLKLTVALFAMALVLVFFGTLAQKNAGIWTVVDQYFWSWYVLIDTQLLVQFAQIFFGISPEAKLSIPIPFPGAKTVGGAMFVNLIAAHILRFKLSWKRAGIFILHGGILLMFVGEFITRTFTVEQQMVIAEGSSTAFTIDTRNYELAVIEDLSPSSERVVAVPARMLRSHVQSEIDLPEVLLNLNVLAYYANSEIFDHGVPGSEKATGPAATAGFGEHVVAVDVPTVSGVDTEKKSDAPCVTVEIVERGGKSLGTYLIAYGYKPQPIATGGKTYTLELRSSHYYKPYSLYLERFRFDRYLGTEKAKNYSSQVRLRDPERGVESGTTIAMNEPLRYRGETFYQSSFTPDETSTVLSVVDNPGWVIPYVSCGVVVFGMLLHFGIHFVIYLLRLFVASDRSIVQTPLERLLSRGVGRRIVLPGREAVPQTRLERCIPWGVLAATILLTLAAAMPHGKPGRHGLDLSRAARLPVVEGGRVKPLDTVARVDLRQINHKEFYISPESKDSRPAIDWWLDTASTDDPATSTSFKAEVFRIENDQVKNLLGLPRREGYRYSAAEIGKKYPELQQAVKKAKSLPEKQRDLLDVKVLELWTKLGTHNAILTGDGTLTIPPAADKPWRTIAGVRSDAENRMFADISRKSGVPIRGGRELAAIHKNLPPEEQAKLVELVTETMTKETAADSAGQAWEGLFSGYRSGNAERFNASLGTLETLAEEGVTPADRARVSFEAFLNDTALYFWCIGLYVLAFLLTVGSWACFGFSPGLGQAWRKSAFLILLFTFALHTFTLISRMYLMDRWFVFVTNLYSTAVFIGWAAVGVSLVVEKLIPITLGCVCASVLGFLTSILAHNLAASGDTLEMMQAVLDTNFWLATHVTTINLGYAATYLAGLIGIVYLLLGIFTPYLRRPVEVNGAKQEVGRIVGQILYGAIAGAMILSFTGTVLGGIWGDQSWGRFWGWDPKENGALMIVIWNALILHARWAGLVKDRGIAVLALGGNMITTWSYFGTNQLGVGLHAYGFSNTLATVCVVMWCVNLGLVAMGMLPKRFWRSY